MSQSLVNEGGGARTPLSGAFAAGIILVVVLFFSHLLADLPQPVTAPMLLEGLLQLPAVTGGAAPGLIPHHSLSEQRPAHHHHCRHRCHHRCRRRGRAGCRRSGAWPAPGITPNRPCR